MGNHAGMLFSTYGHYLYTHLPLGAAVFEMSPRYQDTFSLFPYAAILFPSPEHVLFLRSFHTTDFRGLFSLL